MPQPAPNIIDLTRDSSESDDDCIMLDSPPATFQSQDEPNGTTLPKAESNNNEDQSKTKHDGDEEEEEEVEIEKLKLQSILIKKRAGKPIKQQFKHPSTFARRVEKENPEFTFTIENYEVIWEFCVSRDKERLNREELKKSFPNLDESGLQKEFETQVQRVIDNVSELFSQCLKWTLILMFYL